MKKIPTIFERDWNGDRSRVLDQRVPECQWVFDGEGIPHEKFDGTPVLFQSGFWYKRFDAKQGKTPPKGFVPAQDPDEQTGHWPGWVLIGKGPEDRWINEAIEVFAEEAQEGTYEAIGPKIQGNPYGLGYHTLSKHTWGRIENCPVDFDGLKEWLLQHGVEGVVWHHPDGRMAKIKRRDFGIPWPSEKK